MSEWMLIDNMVNNIKDYINRNYVQSKTYRAYAEDAIMFVLYDNNPYTYEDLSKIFGKHRGWIHRKVQRYKSRRDKYIEQSEFIESLIKKELQHVYDSQRRKSNNSKKD